MSFKVGDVVKWRYGSIGYATVIAIPNDNSRYVLLGWKRTGPQYGWPLHESDDRVRSWGPMTAIHRMFTDFSCAYWVEDSEIRLVQNGENIKTHIFPIVKLYSRVSLKRLQKRMRDQAAQQFLIARG